MALRTDPKRAPADRGLHLPTGPNTHSPAGPPMPLSVGRWQLIRRLGEGAMTCVYLARPAGAPPEQRAAYAVKMPRAGRGDGADDPLAAEMLAREAAVGRSVSNAHLITILASGLRHPPRFIVSPYIEGVSLDVILRREGRLAVPRALWFARQTATALGALHSEGWVHCDVKPANLMVSPDGHLTLIDLGLARRFGEAARADRDVAGTIDYMAPERVTSRLACSLHSDLYSLGVTLFEMLSGRRPFFGRELGDVVRKHRQSAPPELCTIAPHIGPGVGDLVRRLLSKQPLRRATSADEVIGRIAALEVETFGQRVFGRAADESFVPLEK